jgi:hypothetical protein
MLRYVYDTLYEYKELVELCREQNTEMFWETPAPLPLCPPQYTHVFTLKDLSRTAQ